MADALIGHSGFIGSTLLRQRGFDALYRSTNIAEIDRAGFGMVICAGAPAQKWIANKNPENDKEAVDRLIAHIGTIECDKFILISTVDVFDRPFKVDERSEVRPGTAYGSHRRILEEFVAERFSSALIVRLPGLVGPGLRKNVVFDLLNENNLGAADGRSVFQFYPMVNLWSDLRVAIAAKLSVLHLTSEPVSVSEVAEQGFGRRFCQELRSVPVHYDIRSCHADLFGVCGAYQYSKRDTLLAIRAYAQSEPRTSPQAK